MSDLSYCSTPVVPSGVIRDGNAAGGHPRSKGPTSTQATGAQRAVKTIHKKMVKNAEKLQLEIDVMKGLDHPNIVKLYETYEDPRSQVFPPGVYPTHNSLQN